MILSLDESDMVPLAFVLPLFLQHIAFVDVPYPLKIITSLIQNVRQIVC